MRAAAIVVNFNAGPFLAESVAALQRSPDLQTIVIIDNASSDQSLAAIRIGPPSPGKKAALLPHTDLIKNSANTGFAVAVNQGFKYLANESGRASVPELVLVVNPDCVIAPEALGQLLRAMEKHQGAGLAAPLVTTANGVNEAAAFRAMPTPWRAVMNMTGLWRWSARFPALSGVAVPVAKWPQSTAQAEAVSGACMLFRVRAFDQVGGMDEAYRLHCEDLDIMWRLREAGWQCLFVPEARARHVQGVSSRSRRYWVHRQKHLGMLRFYRKHQASEDSWLVRAMVTLGIHARCALFLPLLALRR